ncbi:MAG: hypothetical protein HQL29_04725, partial [Candidatus Omnitrophica bacterium]|nr:hypothetical protein [Candidatus Omnitrophota bacterium]
MKKNKRFLLIKCCLSIAVIFAGFLFVPDLHAEHEKLGIVVGYFVCPTPEGWDRTDNDPYYGDERTYLISFNGPSADGVSVLIYIEFYGEGNEDFDGYEDFVNRNTTNVFDEILAVP